MGAVPMVEDTSVLKGTSFGKSTFDDPAVAALRDQALRTLASRRVQSGTKGSKAGGQGALAGGFVGAILGSMAGNPMAGYALGSQLGSSMGRGDMDMETGVSLAPSVLKMLMGTGAAGAPGI